MRTRIVWIVLLWGLAAHCFSQQTGEEDFSDMLAAAEQAEAQAEALDSGLAFEGTLEVSAAFPLSTDPWVYASAGSSPQAELRLGLEYAREQVRFRSEWFSSFRPKAGTTPADCFDGRPGVQELRYSGRGWSLDSGLLEINWGSADGVNPTDVLNPRDYGALPRPEKLPVLAFQIKYFPVTRLALEAVYIPFRGADLLPFDTLELFPPEITPSTVDPVFSPLSALPALRLSTYLSSLDISLMYAYGFDPYPTAEFSSYSSGPPPTADCELRNSRMHIAGLDVRGAAGALGYWIEAAYSHPQDFDPGSYDLRSPLFDMVVGLDLQFGPQRLWYTNIQGRFRYLPYFDEEYPSDYPGGLPDLGKIADSQYMLEYYRRTYLYTLSEYRERILTGLLFRLSRDNVVNLSLDGALFLPFAYGDTGDDLRFSAFLQPEICFPLPGGIEIACGAVLNGAWRLSGGAFHFNSLDPIGARKEENHLYLKTSLIW